MISANNNHLDNLPQLSYQFDNSQLLVTALTHSGKSAASVDNYERLEFLGDAVLGFVIGAALFQQYPDDREGDLARKRSVLINKGTLAQLASNDLKLENYIRIADAKSTNTANPAILADVLEAIIGAIYLDGDFTAAKMFILELYGDLISELPKTPVDARSGLQEWAQQKGYNLPTYEVLKQDGAAHDPLFTVQVAIPEVGSVAVAQATNKKKAFAMAAEQLLNKLIAEKS